MTSTTYSDVWNLEVFFKGGSDSAELADHLKDKGTNRAFSNKGKELESTPYI